LYINYIVAAHEENDEYAIGEVDEHLDEGGLEYVVDHL
jgi:hypothetical protein